MSNRKRKIILVMVEGYSDRVSFERCIKAFFNTDEVRVKITYGDITSKDFVGADILKCIPKYINSFLAENKYRKSDIKEIVHIIDTDGTFVSDKLVKKGEEKLCYQKDCIITSNPDGIRKRNQSKARALDKLWHALTVCGDIPYRAYFLSRNLEHVLHNREDDVSDKEKKMLSNKFDKKYGVKLKDFINFISDKTFAVQGNYKQTWEFIKKDTNSLHRHSNLHLLFNTKQ